MHIPVGGRRSQISINCSGKTFLNQVILTSTHPVPSLCSRKQEMQGLTNRFSFDLSNVDFSLPMIKLCILIPLAWPRKTLISPPPVKPEGTIGLQWVSQWVSLSVTLVFRTFLRFTFTYLDESWYISSIWRVTDQVWLSSRLTYFFMSYCPWFKIRFPDFSQLCFHISEWKLVASFHMKSYRSSSTFVTDDTLFHELLPFV